MLARAAPCCARVNFVAAPQQQQQRSSPSCRFAAAAANATAFADDDVGRTQGCVSLAVAAAVAMWGFFIVGCGVAAEDVLNKDATMSISTDEVGGMEG